CKTRVENALKVAYFCGEKLREMRGLLHVFYLQPDIIWRFARLDDDDVSDADSFVVPPTNNLAERDIRPFVIRRKVSLHTWSDRGDRFLERVLSVTHTCRKLGQKSFAFLLSSICAARRGLNAPTLLTA
ncbi:MAG: transposase, partial [Gammaproteobacteria bacterium]|nr:transposase [Gammaproteobacteria bacterium]